MKFWHTYGTVIMAIAGAVSPSIQHAIAGHVNLSIALISLWTVIGHMLPSPVASDSSLKVSQ